MTVQVLASDLLRELDGLQKLLEGKVAKLQEGTGAVRLRRVQEMEAVQGQAKASYAAGDHAPEWMTIASTCTLYSLRLWMKDQLDRDAAYILSPQRSLAGSCMHGASMLGFATWSDEDMIGRASWLRWLRTLIDVPRFAA